MGVIARIKNNGDLQIKDEIIEYPDDIQHFATGFRSDGKAMVREFIEGEKFSFSSDKKMYLNELIEGVDMNGTT